MNIKILTEEDKSQFEYLLNTTMNTLDNESFYLPLEDDEKELLFSDDSIIFGLFDRLKLVGTIIVFLNMSNDDLPFGKTLTLGRLMILPEYRGKHLAKQLVNHTINYIKDNYSTKYDAIIATVHPDNKASYHTFKKFGFHKKAEAKYTYNGKEYDRDIIVKVKKDGNYEI